MSGDLSFKVARWVPAAKGAVAATKQAVGLKVFGAIIEGWPVGNPTIWAVNSGRNGDDDGSNNWVMPEGYVGGRSRANWNCSIGAPDKSTNRTPQEKDRAAGYMQETVTGSSVTDELYFTNSMPYSYRLEFDGHSQQAPQGVVRRVLSRFKAIVSEAARENRI